MKNRIFSVDNPKAAKAAGFGYLNAIHYMAPADAAGVGNLCPFASAGCKAACLGLYSGHAAIIPTGKRTNKVRQSRRQKARRFMLDRKAYLHDVVHALDLVLDKAWREGLALCVRMNGSTDVAWEGIAVERDGVAYHNIFEAFPAIQFVDYTKIAARMTRPLPPNYHLTFSRSENNQQTALDMLDLGHNVAVVFAPGPLNSIRDSYYGFSVINGDRHDLRHLDPRGERGFVIALTPKGAKAKKDTSGFVVRT